MVDDHGAQVGQTVHRGGDHDAGRWRLRATEQPADGEVTAVRQAGGVDHDQEHHSGVGIGEHPVDRCRVDATVGVGDHGEQPPSGEGGTKMGEPLHPLPVGRAAGARDEHDADLGRAVEHRSLQHEPAGRRRRAGPVARKPDRRARQQADSEGRLVEHARLFDGGAQLVELVGNLGDRRVPRHVGESERQGEELGMVPAATPEGSTRNIGAPRQLGEVGMHRPASSLLMLVGRAQVAPHVVELGPVAAAGATADAAVAARPVGRRHEHHHRTHQREEPVHQVLEVDHHHRREGHRQQQPDDPRPPGARPARRRW